MLSIGRAWIFLLLATSGAEHARAEIPVGFSTPLTGPHAWVGEPHLAGTELAIADLNAQGGILGEPLALVLVDDGCNPELAPLAAEKLASEAVAVAFGATCSGAAIAASEVYGRAGILMIEAGATNPRLTEGSAGDVFRVVGRDDRQGAMAGDYLADRWRDSSIAIVHDGSAFGRGLADEVKKRLNQRGISETLFAAYQPEALDYSDLLGRLRTAAIDVLYLGGYSPDAGLIIRQARDRDYGVQLVAGDSLSTGEFWLVAGAAGEGTLFTSFGDPTHAPGAAANHGAPSAAAAAAECARGLQLRRRAGVGAGSRESRHARATGSGRRAPSQPIRHCLRDDRFRRQGRRHRLRAFRVVHLAGWQLRAD
jgi:branched-chain amino acid transport system substrate-binding protein